MAQAYKVRGGRKREREERRDRDRQTGRARNRKQENKRASAWEPRGWSAREDRQGGRQGSWKQGCLPGCAPPPHSFLQGKWPSASRYFPNPPTVHHRRERSHSRDGRRTYSKLPPTVALHRGMSAKELRFYFQVQSISTWAKRTKKYT